MRVQAGGLGAGQGRSWAGSPGGGRGGVSLHFTSLHFVRQHAHDALGVCLPFPSFPPPAPARSRWGWPAAWAAPVASSTDTVLASPWLRTTMRYFRGGVALGAPNSLLKKPGSFLSVPGAT